MQKKKLTLPQLMMTAVIIAVFIISSIYSMRRNLRKGVYVGDQFFYQTNASLFERDKKTQISVDKNDSGLQFTITSDGKEKSGELTLDETHVTITYENGPVVDGDWTGERIIDSKTELPLEAAFDEYIMFHSENPKSSELEYSSISNALYQISQNKTTKRSSIFNLLMGAAFYFIGATEFLFPESYHFFLRGWRYKHQELTDEGAFMEKLGGIVVMILGLIALTGIFIS